MCFFTYHPSVILVICPQMLLHHPGIILYLRVLLPSQDLILVSSLPTSYICIYVYVNILIEIQSDMYGQGNHPGIILRSLFSAAVIPVSSWSRRLPRRKRQYFAKKLRQRSHHPIEMWPTRMNHPSGHLQASFHWLIDYHAICSNFEKGKGSLPSTMDC